MRHLPEAWLRAAAAVGARSDVAHAGADLLGRYAEPHRRYHDLGPPRRGARRESTSWPSDAADPTRSGWPPGSTTPSTTPGAPTTRSAAPSWPRRALPGAARRRRHGRRGGPAGPADRDPRPRRRRPQRRGALRRRPGDPGAGPRALLAHTSTASARSTRTVDDRTFARGRAAVLRQLLARKPMFTHTDRRAPVGEPPAPT